MKSGLPYGAITGFVSLAAIVVLPVKADVIHSQPDGYGEVPTLSSPATAEFQASTDRNESQIRYELTYEGFTTAVRQAHIHLGRRGVNGGIMVFLCTNLGNGPAGTPPCPSPAGTVTGVLTVASVVGPAEQGIVAGEFAEVIAAIRNGAAYVNIHTEAFPSGEIRDQVSGFRSRRSRHDRD